MEWIDRDEQFPEEEKILVSDGNIVFICELVESKWGNFYHSTDWAHGEFQNMPEWTHWMPLPKLPGKQ